MRDTLKPNTSVHLSELGFETVFYPSSTIGENSKDNLMKTVKLQHKTPMTIDFSRSLFQFWEVIT